MVSMNLVVREKGIPTLDLWELILQRKVKMIVYEDNQATSKIIRSGKFPKLGHVHRCHGVQLSLLTQELNKDTFVLEDCHTKAMKADIFTKYFTDAAKWSRAQILIGISEDANSLLEPKEKYKEPLLHKKTLQLRKGFCIYLNWYIPQYSIL